jgi:phage shock protein PspC (stress-responsive transcriptional regulator)
VFNIDPTFIRIGFVAALLISWKLALVAYVAAGIYLSLKEAQGAARRGTPVGL